MPEAGRVGAGGAVGDGRQRPTIGQVPRKEFLERRRGGDPGAVKRSSGGGVKNGRTCRQRGKSPERSEEKFTEFRALGKGGVQAPKSQLGRRGL